MLVVHELLETEEDASLGCYWHVQKYFMAFARGLLGLSIIVIIIKSVHSVTVCCQGPSYNYFKCRLWCIAPLRMGLKITFSNYSVGREGKGSQKESFVYALDNVDDPLVCL